MKTFNDFLNERKINIKSNQEFSELIYDYFMYQLDKKEDVIEAIHMILYRLNQLSPEFLDKEIKSGNYKK